MPFRPGAAASSDLFMASHILSVGIMRSSLQTFRSLGRKMSRKRSHAPVGPISLNCMGLERVKGIEPSS